MIKAATAFGSTFTLVNRVFGQLKLSDDPDREPRLFDPFCPLRNVTKEYPPTLLLHGDNDTDVPFEQSVLMAKELERHGILHELIRCLAEDTCSMEQCGIQ